MAVKEFMESEVAIAVMATAAIFSPRVRRVLRRGAVYGLAGVLKVGDALAVATRDIQLASVSAGTTPQDATLQTEASPEGSTPTPAAVLRRGVVSGLAKAIIVGDAVSAAAHDLRRDVQQAAHDATVQAQTSTVESSAPAEGKPDA